MEQTKEFPEPSKSVLGTYHRVFSGYGATHYRVRMQADRMPEPQQRRYCDVGEEIQVASVLMHAWSEVEHDLVYKPAAGALSAEEYAILDEINGIVLAGEIALQRLQGAVRQRLEVENKPFSSQYELAAYLHDNLRMSRRFNPAELVMGRVDILLGFLQRIGENRPKQLDKYLDQLPTHIQEGPVAEQLAKSIIATNPDWLSDYADAQREASDRGYGDYTYSQAEAGARNYWVLPAGNTETMSAVESLRLWLDHGMWGMRKSTPHRRHLMPGDRVCFYAARVGVVATAEIAGKADQLIPATESPEPNYYTEPLYKVPVANVRWLPNPVVLDEPLRAQLDAFRGRSTMGMWAWFIHARPGLPVHIWVASSADGRRLNRYRRDGGGAM